MRIILVFHSNACQRPIILSISPPSHPSHNIHTHNTINTYLQSANHPSIPSPPLCINQSINHPIPTTKTAPGQYWLMRHPTLAADPSPPLTAACHTQGKGMDGWTKGKDEEE